MSACSQGENVKPELEVTKNDNEKTETTEQNDNQRKFQQNSLRRKKPYKQQNENLERKFPSKRYGFQKSGEGSNVGLNRKIENKIQDRLAQNYGSTYDLPPLEITEKKFSSKNRLFIGNLPSDTTNEEINDLFRPFGETYEIFINKDKNFGFIKLDFRVNAEKAKRSLDGTLLKGRLLKVRFAPNNTTLKVLNLTPFVTNELLYIAFSIFGEIERCVVIVDDHGKSIGEGIIEFVRKPSAQLAFKQCTDGCFFLTSSLRPVIVEFYDQNDDADGFPEKTLTKKTSEYYQAREIGPRFAAPGSFEYEYGIRWKQLHELYKQKSMFLKNELKMEQEKLEAQMQFAKFEHETEMLREQLRAREMDTERKKREWEEHERIAKEKRLLYEEQSRRQQEEMFSYYQDQDQDEFRNRQEKNLFLQAHQLTNMLDQQDQLMQSYSSSNISKDNFEQGAANEENKNANDSYGTSYDKNKQYENRNRFNWDNDYPYKRYRY